jgi:peptide/nickel transport system substrate-binding protein
VTHETDDDGNVVPGSLGVEAVGDYRFRVTLERPFASVLSLIAYSAFAAVPEGIVGDVEGYDGEMDQSTFATNPVGCGPFAFELWSQGEAAEVTAFVNYHGRSPSVDGVRWQIIDDGTARYNYFMNRNADVAGIPTSQYNPSLLTVERTDDLGRQRGTYGPVRNGETLNWARVPTLTTFYIGFNTREVPLPVRKAMAYVVDQRQFVETVFKDRFVPAYHLTPPLLYPGGASAYWKHAEPGD